MCECAFYSLPLDEKLYQTISKQKLTIILEKVKSENQQLEYVFIVYIQRDAKTTTTEHISNQQQQNHQSDKERWKNFPTGNRFEEYEAKQTDTI